MKVFTIVGIFLLLANMSLAQQLKFTDHDYEQNLSPDGKQVIFVRAIKTCPYTPETGWAPADFDEIWSVDINGANQRCLIKNNYSEQQDMEYYLGSFNSLTWSADSKYIYFLCQNCPTNAILYKVDRDGSNIKKLCYAHGISGVIGGNMMDEFYGYLVLHVKKYNGDDPTRWVTILMNPEGKEVKEIENLNDFWAKHKRLKEE